VWIAQNDDIPLVLENGSLDLLMEQVRIAAPEILELNGREHEDMYLEFTTNEIMRQSGIDRFLKKITVIFWANLNVHSVRV
jgi:hypothetical protein